MEQIRKISKTLVVNWKGYIFGLGLTVLCTLIGRLLILFFAPANVIMVFLLCVTVTAIFWGLGPSIFVSVLSVLAFDFFLVPPYFTFAVADTQYIFTFTVLLLVGIVISYLTAKIQEQTKESKQQERETAILYSLSRNLNVTAGLDDTLKTITRGIHETFGCNTLILLSDSLNSEKFISQRENQSFTIDEGELKSAVLSIQNQETTGQKPDMLQYKKARYVPLKTSRGMIGIMVLQSLDTPKDWTAEQTRLLKVFAGLAAVAIEHIQLAEKAKNAQILEATEKLQTALLNSISHDLRTPLVSVIGVLSSLQEKDISLDDEAKRNLIQVAREEAERLNHLITNLLDVSRVESGTIKMSRQLFDVQDLVGTALEQMGGRARTHQININVPIELPLVFVDFGLIVQTLVNVLDNAQKYSPADSPIDIKARQTGHEVYIEIADHGVGIPSQDLLHVFDKFYRIQRPDNVAGTGLGLSICKGIVEAHDGKITAENRTGGGTVIRLVLPVSDPSKSAEEKADA
ncbi:MAG: DUF4118 domain-containing protein [Dehalococcoidales bacterium]|nr:DUF4118 domain-containing protein [Dehalococcoidales bacterium]